MQEATATVYAMSKIAISGNVIPQEWYHRLKDGRGNAYLAAIVILSDIVYWYRPRIVRNEATGAIQRYERRFAADKLQRSYSQIAAQFGLSKGQAKHAIDYLCERGLIEREFRNVVWRNQTIANVMFLEPIPAAIADLCAPLEILPEPEEPPTTRYEEALGDIKPGEEFREPVSWEEEIPLSPQPQIDTTPNDTPLGHVTRETYTETSSETSSETSQRREEPDGRPSGWLVPTCFADWLKALGESSNRQAVLRCMYETLFPGHDPPDYAYMAKVAKQMGGASKLAAELWLQAVRPPVGDVLAYIQATAGRKKREHLTAQQMEEERRNEIINGSTLDELTRIALASKPWERGRDDS